MLNKVQIIGRLGVKPELKYTQNGTAMCALSIATDESYQDRNGYKIEKVEWHKAHVWERTAENCAQYLDKGSLVYVEGSLNTRKWQDQSGQTRYVTEIKVFRVQFLDRAGQGQERTQEYAQEQAHIRENTSHSTADTFSVKSFADNVCDIDKFPF